MIGKANGIWLMVAPMVHLSISEDTPINGSWVVGDVTFYSQRSLREKLAQQHPIDEIKGLILTNDFPAFATLERRPDDVLDEKDAFSKLRQAAMILAATTAFSVPRSFRTGFGIIGDPQLSCKRIISLEMDGPGFTATGVNLGNLMPFELNDCWLQEVQESGIIGIFERVKDHSIDPDWCRQIRRLPESIARLPGQFCERNTTRRRNPW